MTDKLSQLKAMTDVVADTGDIEAIKRFAPRDATTNPSLLLKAAALPHYQQLLQAARAQAAREGGSSARQLAACCDHFAVAVGAEILSIVPGRVSTEVDARLSFDSSAMIEKARRLTALYEERNIRRSRILIKLASTWEGINAARQLEKEGIQCNLTLLFGFAQAQACADAGVFLISPFVGRIFDWYRSNSEIEINSPDDDPGVQSVRRIYRYYKQHGYATVVMGASFRNTGQIEALAGCDRLTISPELLETLASDTDALPRQLDPQSASSDDLRKALKEPDFRMAINQDAMSTEKLAEGIRNFITDQIKLEKLVNAL